MGMNNRPGGTYKQIVNGYAVILKKCDDMCPGICEGCNCGAESHNLRVRADAESNPPKNPPDKLPPICGPPSTTYQLAQQMFQVDEILKDLRIQHQPGCTYRANLEYDTCVCSVKQVLEKIRAARELLKLE